MGMFNSRDQLAFNTDPQPLVRISDGARGGWELRGTSPTGQPEALIVAPRAEYTPTPHTPPRGALVSFRKMHGTKRGTALSDAAIAWRTSLGPASLAGVYGVDEAAHAARVLSRIAAPHPIAA